MHRHIKRFLTLALFLSAVSMPVEAKVGIVEMPYRYRYPYARGLLAPTFVICAAGSDRSQKRFIIFDEAWQFFKDSSLLKDVIEEGYRRARKYGGSFTTITQSLLDFENFGQVGSVIMSNSAFKFLLESLDFEKA